MANGITATKRTTALAIYASAPPTNCERYPSTDFPVIARRDEEYGPHEDCFFPTTSKNNRPKFGSGRRTRSKFFDLETNDSQMSGPLMRPKEINSNKTKNDRGKHGVRFASKKEVRTYSIVMGVHPLCKDGLAIELGWDHDGGQIIDDAKEVWNDDSDKCSDLYWDFLKSSLRRRSYLERKRLLMEVGGYEDVELCMILLDGHDHDDDLNSDRDREHKSSVEWDVEGDDDDSENEHDDDYKYEYDENFECVIFDDDDLNVLERSQPPKPLCKARNDFAFLRIGMREDLIENCNLKRLKTLKEIHLSRISNPAA